MAGYALAEHVFVCVNGEQLVFLDLKKDRYWALEASRTAGLGVCVSGWPVPVPADGAMRSETDGLLEVLRERGILVGNIRPGKDATPVAARPPLTELLSEAETLSEPAIRCTLEILVASVAAKLALRLCPLERVVRRVRRRKLARAGGAELDVRHARRLIGAFVRHRVFLFSSRDQCLYDSLSLLEFLARHRIYPDWVFAVQTRPFAAHCWIQHGSIVFNDTVEHVSGYTPIMVV